MSPDREQLLRREELREPSPAMELGTKMHADLEAAYASAAESFVVVGEDEPNGTPGQRVLVLADTHIGKSVTLANLTDESGKMLSEQQLKHLKQIISTMRADSAEYDRERHIEKVRAAIAAKGFKRAIGEMFDQRERKQLAIKVHHNPAPAPIVVALTKAARYAPCPCGSGKKLKFCCGGGR